MNAFEEMKMKLLDELEKVIDEHEIGKFVEGKNPDVAVIKEEKSVIPVDGEMAPDETVETEIMAKPKGKPMYMDPAKEDVLQEVEQLSSRNDDPILMRGQFAKRKA